MMNRFVFRLGLTLTVLVGSLALSTATPAQQTECAMQLTVELTPDVPDPGDPGFLSSLLNNHPGYRLELLQVIDAALVELDLSGPGPGYLCEAVVDTIRKDGRVLSVRTNRHDAPSVAAISPTPGRVRISDSGLGSLYWAANHPSESWRVLLPVRPGEEPADNARSPAMPIRSLNRGIEEIGAAASGGDRLTTEQAQALMTFDAEIASSDAELIEREIERRQVASQQHPPG